VAFAPAAVPGFLAGAIVESLLFGVVPVAVARMAGGPFILGTRDRPWTGGGRLDLELIGVRQGAVIGLAQTVALWPGIGRSLVTILAAFFVGCSMKAAVGFSFLLGLVTL